MPKVVTCPVNEGPPTQARSLLQAWGLTPDTFLLLYFAEVSGKLTSLAGVAPEVRVCHLTAVSHVALLSRASLREFV